MIPLVSFGQTGSALSVTCFSPSRLSLPLPPPVPIAYEWNCSETSHLAAASVQIRIQIAWEVFAANLFTASAGAKERLARCLSSLGREKTRLHMLVTLQDTFSEKIHFHFPTHPVTDGGGRKQLKTQHRRHWLRSVMIVYCISHFPLLVRLSKLQKVKSPLACCVSHFFFVFFVELLSSHAWVSLGWLQVPRTKQIGRFCSFYEMVSWNRNRVMKCWVVMCYYIENI